MYSCMDDQARIFDRLRSAEHQPSPPDVGPCADGELGMQDRDLKNTNVSPRRLEERVGQLLVKTEAGRRSESGRFASPPPLSERKGRSAKGPVSWSDRDSQGKERGGDRSRGSSADSLCRRTPERVKKDRDVAVVSSDVNAYLSLLDDHGKREGISGEDEAMQLVREFAARKLHAFSGPPGSK